MRRFLTVIAVGLALTAGVRASAAQFTTVNTIESGEINIPESAATPEQIKSDLETFNTEFRDLAGLFTADDFRSPGAAKVIEKIKFDSPETQIKLAAYKKKLDQLQKKMRSLLSLQAVVVGENQFPRIHALAKEAARKLELGPNFKIFILRSPVFNAFTYSYNTEDFDVVLHSAAVENLSDDALLALLGHEMGHVKDQAMLMQMVLAASFEARNTSLPAATNLMFYEKLFEELPKSLHTLLQQYAQEIVASKGLIASFDTEAEASEFSRNCEITADRAAVIVSGDEKAPLKLMSALAYGSKALTPEFNQDELMKQIREVLSQADSIEDIQFLVNNQESHPFSVLRLIQVSDYAASTSFTTLKKRLNQDSFNKELEQFIRLYVRTGITAGRLKKYLAEKADTDDTLIRLKTQDMFSKSLKRLGDGINSLGSSVLAQVIGSNLAKKDNKLFNDFVAKVKADKEDALKKVLLPALMGVISKQAEKALGDDKAELLAKLKILSDLKELE